VSWPSFVVGTVHVRVPKLNIWLGLLCMVVAFAGQASGSSVLLAVGIGGLAALPIVLSLHWLSQWRFNRRAKDWPVQVQVMAGPDGERIAFVTALDGTVSTLVIPEDYTPEDDGGLWLIQQVAPSLAELIADDEDD